ncbi:MAG TPA: mechanosensitive ion channel family protein [Croceibacterium sp.]
MRVWTIALAMLLALGSTAPLQAALPLPAPESAEPPAEPDAPIALSSPDAQIAARLRQVYGAIDGLEGVRARVEGGVVVLSGTTLDDAARDEAQTVAARVTGVVSVDNGIEVEHRLSRRIAPIIAQSQALGERILAYLPLFAFALVVLAAFWMAGVLLTRWTNLFRRVVRNPFIEALLEQIVRLAFILAGVVVAMSILGATALIGSVLGAAGVLGLAIGFAMRDTIENYIASILLSVRRPFAPHDSVIIEGVEGRITTLNSRATIITTWDGNEVRIPNALVYKTKIVNLTRTPERRFEFELRVRLDTDISCALAIALGAAKGVEGVLDTPAPAALVSRIDEYAIVLVVQGWVDQTRSDFNKVKGETIRVVKEAFDAEDIDLAQPVQIAREWSEPRRPEAARTREPSAAEMREIKDTSRDTTIDRKVAQQRAEADNDLLTTAAPRE